MPVLAATFSLAGNTPYRRGAGLTDHVLHELGDRGGGQRARGLQPRRGTVGLDQGPRRVPDLLHHVRRHDGAAVGDPRGHQRHLQRGGDVGADRRALTECRIGLERCVVQQFDRGREVGHAHPGQVEGDLLVEPESLRLRVEARLERHPHLGEGRVARLGKSLLDRPTAHLVVVVAERQRRLGHMDAADLRRGRRQRRRVVRLGERRLVVVDGGRGDHLERRTGQEPVLVRLGDEGAGGPVAWSSEL